jgi:hypothetical protein
MDMNSVIVDINNSLRSIVDELEQKQKTSDESLAIVQRKIDEKIDEAKKYKVDVDNAKARIKELEADIEALKVDLADLNERFGNKDLSAVLDAGNKEINSKIIDKQNEITRNRDRISELTDRARTIKDLLVNLKKDKENKKGKLDFLTRALSYYKKSINNITEYAEAHPNDLSPDAIIPTETNITENLETIPEVTRIAQTVEDTSSPIFDEIEVLSNDDENSLEQTPPAVNSQPVVETPVVTTPVAPEPTPEPDNEINIFNNDEVQTATPAAINTNPAALKTLNDNIDKEYANIFGDNEAINIDEQEEFTPQVPPKNIFDQNDLQEEREADKPVISSISSLDSITSLTPPSTDTIKPVLEDVTPITVEPLAPAINDNSGISKKVIFGEEEKPNMNSEDDTKLVNYFTPLGIDYYSFKLSSQDYLKRVFNLEKFNKIIEILKNNKIPLDNIYTSQNIFGESTPAEIEHVITKLIALGQTPQNIGYVLNTIPLINSFDLQDVADSYGPLIKDANITDLIIKAKHLSDTGGNR